MTDARAEQRRKRWERRNKRAVVWRPSSRNIRSLSRVTLACADCIDPDAGLRALQLSARNLEFAEVILFSDRRPTGALGIVRWVQIPKMLTRDAYNIFTLRELHKHIQTPHVLTVQADGWVINPNAWDDAWLNFDWVGAPWPDGVDGNSGVCLRSVNLLQCVAENHATDADLKSTRQAHRSIMDDIYTCRDLGPTLTAAGFRFAPPEVAARFSFERPTEHQDTWQDAFAFHGTRTEETRQLGASLMAITVNGAVAASASPDASPLIQKHTGRLIRQFDSTALYAVAPVVKSHERQTVRCDVALPYCETNLPEVHESINSILNQSHADCIVHAVNDGFDPASDSGLRDRFTGNGAVRFYRNAEAVGPYATTNRLFDYFETEFLAIQDSDDLSSPNRIWHSITTLERSGADFFAARMEQFIDHKANPSAVHSGRSTLLDHLRISPYLTSGIRWEFAPRGCIVNATMACRRNAFESVNGFWGIFCGSDNEFATRILAAKYSLHISDEIVGWRRLHGKSLSRSKAYGLASDQRGSYMKEMRRRYMEYDRPTFDPIAFGDLDVQRRSADLERVA